MGLQAGGIAPAGRTAGQVLSNPKADVRSEVSGERAIGSRLVSAALTPSRQLATLIFGRSGAWLKQLAEVPNVTTDRDKVRDAIENLKGFVGTAGPSAACMESSSCSNPTPE